MFHRLIQFLGVHTLDNRKEKHHVFDPTLAWQIPQQPSPWDGQVERAAAMATSFLTSLNFLGRAVCGMWSQQMQVTCQKNGRL